MDIHRFLAMAGGSRQDAPRSGPPPAQPSPDAAGRREVSVTWHEPCHLGYAGTVEEPPEIIAALPGVNYVETGGRPGCCGGGGAFSLRHRDLALKIGLARAEKIAASGAEIVATGCPACRIHLSDVLGRAGVPVRVVHTVDLIPARDPVGAAQGSEMEE